MANLQALRCAWAVAQDPRDAFERAARRSFEQALHQYLVLLLLCGALAAAASFTLMAGKAVFYQLFLHADVDYIRMLNYAFGRATSVLFLSFFLGTVVVFAIALVFWGVVRGKLTRALQAVFLACSPLLLFGWLLPLLPGLLVWTLLLLVVGARAERSRLPVRRRSIEQRD